MYQLKPYTTVVKKSATFPTVDCYVGALRIGYIVQNLMRSSTNNFGSKPKKNNSKYVFCFTIIIDSEVTHLYADTQEELQEAALNKFRQFICDLLL